MSKPKTIYSSDGRSGVDVTYIRSRRELRMGGWYDSFVGIEPFTLSLGDFLRRLGITLDDCRKALNAKAAPSDGAAPA